MLVQAGSRVGIIALEEPDSAPAPEPVKFRWAEACMINAVFELGVIHPEATGLQTPARLENQ